MTNRRSKLEVAYSILRAIKRGNNHLNQNKILIKANLNFMDFMFHIPLMKEKGLINETVNAKNGRKIYSLTDKGDYFYCCVDCCLEYFR